MKIVGKREFKEYPAGTVFTEYTPCVCHDIEIKKGNDFWATTLLPDLEDGSIFTYDWNLAEYGDDDMFIVFEEKDILQMIKLLQDSLTTQNEKAKG